jgi:hypothetical protein
MLKPTDLTLAYDFLPTRESTQHFDVKGPSVEQLAQHSQDYDHRATARQHSLRNLKAGSRPATPFFKTPTARPYAVPTNASVTTARVVHYGTTSVAERLSSHSSHSAAAANPRPARDVAFGVIHLCIIALPAAYPIGPKPHRV